MKKLGYRIKTRRKLKGLTQEALGLAVGVSKVSVSSWELGKNSMHSELLNKVAGVLGVDAHWLLTGESFATLEDERDSVFWAPKYKNIKAAAGAGCCHDDCLDEDEVPIPRRFVKNQTNKDQIFCVCVSGDSMEPVLSDGSIIAINSSDTIIKDGKMYLVKQDDLLRVKIIHLLPKEMVLKSFNPNFKDETYNIKKDNIQILGRVFWFTSGR
ncbi:MAG: XRE family transcriptional regulator [Saezia sp.]